jgi:hypothetical protein
MDRDETPDAIVVELSLPEAMTVLAALRQYMPYWQSECDLSPEEQLATLHDQIYSVIGKIRFSVS